VSEPTHEPTHDMLELHEDVGALGFEVAGPPWILGHRGAPREAPENTLAGLRRALELGLDGFEYDLRACATGEAVLMHDATLDRTTDASGPLARRTVPELFGIDAGAWFGRRFRGEPVPLLDEALDIVADTPGRAPLHMIELKEPGLVASVAGKLRALELERSARVASFLREIVLEARDAGLPSMLLAVNAEEDDRRFVRDERVDAYATGPGGWRAAAGAADWSFCERWSWSVDDPGDLLEACRVPLFGFNTNEPRRALATRALTRLAPGDRGPYPVVAPELVVVPEGLRAEERARGEWYGSWSRAARVRNPLPFAVVSACSVFLRGGAFEFEGLPQRFPLEPGEERDVPLRVVGGSRSPGPDPLFAAQLFWRAGPGRCAGRLLLDAPLTRVRLLRSDAVAQRLSLLAERPGDPPASMIVQQSRRDLLVSIESPGDLEDAHVLAHLAGHTARGGRGLRLRLPEDFEERAAGVAFSCGIEGRRGGKPAFRRWAGGVPEGIEHGKPGRLVPRRA